MQRKGIDRDKRGEVRKGRMVVVWGAIDCMELSMVNM